MADLVINFTNISIYTGSAWLYNITEERERKVRKMYDVMMKAKGEEPKLYKVCPNKGYARVVASGENTAQYAKGIYIGDPRFVDYYVVAHK